MYSLWWCDVSSQSPIKWYMLSLCNVLMDSNHLVAACFKKQIRLQMRSIWAKAIPFTWYYNIQMLINVALQSISREKRHKGPPSSFSGQIISKSLILKCYHLPGGYNIAEIYLYCNINMHNIHMTENCLNCKKLYSKYHPFMLCVAMYWKNWMEPYCPWWLSPMEMLETEVST